MSCLSGHTALGSIKVLVLDPDNSLPGPVSSPSSSCTSTADTRITVCTLHEALTEAREQTAGRLTVSPVHIDAIYRSTHGNICKHSLFDSKPEPGPPTDSHFYTTLRLTRTEAS